MKLMLVVALCSGAFACGPKGGEAGAGPAAPSAPPPTAEDKNCGRSIPGPGKRAEGEECGGSTNISCADGLTCFSMYRCPGSIGTCKKK